MGGMEGGGRDASNRPLSNKIQDFVSLLGDGSIALPTNCMMGLIKQLKMQGAKTGNEIFCCCYHV